MQTTTVGLFVGLILGLALAIEGFGAMLIVAFTGLVGYLTAKVVTGELDLSEYVGGTTDRGVSRS
ncbi:MAG: DUF2273 domain-containing protein [Actinomycetota bacterium]|jgi:hypothetical protein